MRRLALAIGLLTAALGAGESLAAPAPPTPLPPLGTMVHWQADKNADPQSYTDGRLTLTVFRRTQPDGGVKGMMTIAVGWAKVMQLDGAVGVSFAPVDFGVARLDASAGGPGVLFTTFTGGAHCCVRVEAAEPLGGAWRRVWVGEFDTDAPGRLSDLDGDGVADIVMIDDAFDYAFASFAGSRRPPAIFNLRNGVAWNVSAEPKYRKLFAGDLKDAQAGCTQPAHADDEVNGVCAAFVADAARLGRLDWAWPLMLAHYNRKSKDWPDGCKVEPVKGQCPKAQVIAYPDYPTALKAFLRKQGYIPSSGAPLSQPVPPRPPPGEG